MRVPPIVALLLCLSATARADPPRLQARFALGPLYDRNPARDTAPEGRVPSGGVTGVVSVDGSLQESPVQLSTLAADVGLRWFSAARSESQLASRLALTHAVRTGDRLALVLSGSAQDRQLQGNERESSSLEGTAGGELGPWDWFSARLYGGARRFVYRADGSSCGVGPCRSFTGPLAGTALRGEVSEHHAFTASFEIDDRFYDSGETSSVSVVGLDWSYRGRVLVGAGWQLVLGTGDPIFRGNRQRFSVLAGTPIAGDVILSLEATYQIPNNVLVTEEDDEKYSSLGAKLSRPLAGPVSLESTLRWYHSFRSTTPYDRLIVVLAAVVTVGNP
jgi:hypothetical protein